jgi:hypothetical protein
MMPEDSHRFRDIKMSISLKTLLLGGALLIVGTQAHAQAKDVDCVRCVDTSDIAGEAINTYKIKPKAVTTSKLAKQAVTTSKIAPGAVTENKLSANLSNAMLGARNPRVLDAGDNEIGQLLSIGENHISFEVITQQGYLITLSPVDGMVGQNTNVFYASADCSGTGHAFGYYGSIVFRTYDLNGAPMLVYIHKDSVPIEDFSYGSYIFDAGGCNVQAGQATAFPVLPNDSSTTGVFTDTYQLPLKIAHP